MRAGNIVAAAEPLNAALKAAGSDKTVKVEVFEGPATGYDADALDILKAFAVNQGPDVYVAAHEWVGEFAKSGYAMDMDDFVKANPWAFADVIPVLWDATKYKGKIYAIPQDSEIRMFFYNKDMLRKIGKDEAFIEGLPALVDKGEFTMTDLSNLAKEVVDKGAAQIGIIHRPNAGPDYLMKFAALRREVHRPQDRQAAAAQGRDQARRSNGSPGTPRTASRRRTTPPCRGTRSRAPSRPRRRSSTTRASGR